LEELYIKSSTQAEAIPTDYRNDGIRWARWERPSGCPIGGKRARRAAHAARRADEVIE